MNEELKDQKQRMYEIKSLLHEKANEISELLNGAPVVIVTGGSTKHDVPATCAGWANMTDERESRFRDVVGLLQSAIQIESFWHYMEDDLFQDLKNKLDGTRVWSRGRKR
jgi:hypothetical protein